ncbi:type II secretion system F family protein [Arthrobacter castelli]|uniref:type II secretion system F family protein n=1 Tax=Arthrobacter castelli TaxID=271431 RepID=UPI0003F85FE1|nr:hypothetical protein [Arthrobacter castelli]
MTTALLTTMLLAIACALLLGSGPLHRFAPRPAPDGEPIHRRITRRSRRQRGQGSGLRAAVRRLAGAWLPAAPASGDADPWLMPMLVHQLASLLEAGRSPQVVWAEAAASYVRYRESAGDAKAGSFDPDTDRLLAVLRAADRSAALGHGVAPVLRSYGRDAVPGKSRGGPRERRMSRIWADLAACWDVAELSGAPLSRLLSRYAGALEAELDADAARQTALAGPRATVKLLAWLPVFGLGLGLLMGVDPVGILFGTPVGLAAFAAGTVLMVAGRFWSHRMVAAAEELS